MNSDLTLNPNLPPENYPQLPEMISVWQETLNWQPTISQQLLFQRFYALILEANQQLNLTRITEATEFWEKHLWDSLRGILTFLKDEIEEKSNLALKAIDIGTGAGFPGIPIAIILPNWQITLLDSTRKKIAFLETAISQLAITNATTFTSRAEEIGQQIQHRACYDIALIRAVASPSVCAEYAVPLLKIGGLAILYRGQQTDEEIEALKFAVTKLGATIESIDSFTTPCSNAIRHCIYLRKVSATPTIFPRLPGVPTQKPLDLNYGKQKH